MTVDSPEYYDTEKARRENANSCIIYKYPRPGVDYAMQCYNPCKAILDQAKEEGRTSNYGCVGFFPLSQSIPWEKVSGFGEVAGGKCSCDNMAMTAAEMVNYVYNKDQDPGGAFEWWLSPCGGSDLVPDEIKNAFDILSAATGGVSSFKEPKNIPKGSGKKGDDANPRSPTAPRKPRPNNNSNNGGVTKPPQKPKCSIKAADATRRMGEARNTLRMQECAKDKTVVTELVITSLVYAANALPTQVTATCDGNAWPQACYHYQSAISVNKQWATLTCPPEAASTKHRENGVATRTWAGQHKGTGWKDKAKRVWQRTCDRDEYPPAYLLSPNDPAMSNGGLNSKGQLVRYIPDAHNRPAGSMWKGACFQPVVKDLSDAEFKRRVNAAPAAQKQIIQQGGGTKILLKTQAAVTVDSRPEFTMKFDHGAAPRLAGLNTNPCWPHQAAQKDPGFALLTFDPFYGGMAPPYDFAAKYVKGSNGIERAAVCD